MASQALSKTQIDRLGDRLRKGQQTNADVKMLDEYRSSFGEAFELVIDMISELGEFPTGRISKSTVSIIEKLRRESIRLSQMQDISGCRVVVADLLQQDIFVTSLRTLFPGASVVDRRENPSYGYRAVHVIVVISEKPVEIQIRTSLQHLWAELSEKASDSLDPRIKYGGGSNYWRNFLLKCSNSVATFEEEEKGFRELADQTEMLMGLHGKVRRELLPKLYESDTDAEMLVV